MVRGVAQKPFVSTVTVTVVPDARWLGPGEVWSTALVGFTEAVARHAPGSDDPWPEPWIVIVAESLCVLAWVTGLVASRVHFTVTRTRSTSGTTDASHGLTSSGLAGGLGAPHRHATSTCGTPTTSPPSRLVTAATMAV